MKTILILIYCVGAVLNSHAQTNSIPATNTNEVDVQFKAVCKALPRCFTFKTADYGCRTIEQSSDDQIVGDDNDMYVRLNILCITSSSNMSPAIISIKLESKMPEQQFTKGKIYTIEVDDSVISPNECSSFCAGLAAPFFENMNSDVSLEQFRKMAWADSVWMKSDHLPIEIPYNARQKWKLLWKYFDLKKSMDSKN